VKPPRFLATRDFWFAVSLAALSLVSVFLWNQNRALLNENHSHLVRLCDTTTTLDVAVVVPLLTETRAALEFLPPGHERRRAARIAQNLQVAHEELSKTTLCERVS
jgi:hypothetical protein